MQLCGVWSGQPLSCTAQVVLRCQVSIHTVHGIQGCFLLWCVLWDAGGRAKEVEAEGCAWLLEQGAYGVDQMRQVPRGHEGCAIHAQAPCVAHCSNELWGRDPCHRGQDYGFVQPQALREARGAPHDDQQQQQQESVLFPVGCTHWHTGAGSGHVHKGFDMRKKEALLPMPSFFLGFGPLLRHGVLRCVKE